jgi:beta-lysine 5,6-aminomutase beta subunit
MAGSLGVDKIFGKGTGPAEVASYLAHALAPVPAAAKDTAAAGGARVPAALGAVSDG